MRYTAAWCSHEPAAVALFFSVNGSLQINDGEPAMGRSAIAEAARAFMIAFPDLHVRMDDLVLEGDQVEYRWTLTGTHDAPGGKGQRVQISGFEQWQFAEDGLIAASRGQFD